MLVLPLLALCLTQGDLKPLFVESETPPASLDHTLAVAKSLKLDLPNEQITNIKGLRDYRAIFETEGFPSSHGKLWYLNESMELRQASYWTVPSLDRYYEFVDNEAKRRRGHVEISPIDDTKVRLRSVDSSFPDAWSNYHDGLCISGYSSDIHRISLSAVSKWAKTANGKQYACVLRLNGIPKAIRERIVKRVRTDLSVSMQQRDGEEDAQYRLRKCLTSTLISFVEKAMRDVTECRVWSELPSDEGDSSFQLGLRVYSKRGSELRALLDAISTRRVSLSAAQLDRSDGILGSAEVHCAMPDAVRKLILDAGIDFDSVTSPEWGLLGRILASKRLDGVLVVPSNSQTPSALGALTVAQARGDRTHVVLEGSRACGDGYHLAWGSQDGLLRVAVASDPKLNTVDEYLSKERRNGNASLAMVNFDFEDWIRKGANDDEPSSKLVKVLERAFDKWSAGASKRRFSQRLRIALTLATSGKKNTTVSQIASQIPARTTKGDFESVLGRLGSEVEGDWTSRASIRVAGGRLTARLEVGDDLYELLRARQLLAAKLRVQGMMSMSAKPEEPAKERSVGKKK